MWTLLCALCLIRKFTVIELYGKTCNRLLQSQTLVEVFVPVEEVEITGTHLVRLFVRNAEL